MQYSRLRGAVVWRKIARVVEEDSPTAIILRALVDHYRESRPYYIPAYEVDVLFEKNGLKKELHWKSFIDLSCYTFRLFDLKFHFIFDDDEIEITFEQLQTIISGASLTIGSCEYSASVASKNIYPYLVPENRFYWLQDCFLSATSVKSNAS